MIKAGQIDKGTALLIKGQAFVCIDREFVNPGKGSAFVRLKLKSPATGQILSETMKSQDNAEEITVEDRDVQYLYNDSENFHLMLTDTYDQIEVPMGNFPDYQYLMKEGETYRCTFWEDQLLDLQIPSKVVYKVVDAEEAIKGDTVQGATKYVTTECGLKVRVPIFIKKGEKIRINTETKEYLERVND
ncbi:MAG: elongation factor P [Spirochaetia bacterium]|jgi:elongation factor P|nr:elongation factor P [Spirochaetia bacterium]